MIWPIHHVDLVATDLERSLAFYQELLGWTESSEIEGERGERVVYIWPPGRDGAGSLGLRAAQSDANPVPYERYGVGLHHLAFNAGSRAEVDERVRLASDEGYPDRERAARVRLHARLLRRLLLRPGRAEARARPPAGLVSEVEQRVSDADRERAVDLLGAHMVSGVLSADELATRSELVLSARTQGDLSRALRDLPRLPRRPLLVRVADLVPLRTHVIVFLVVNAVLVTLWAATRERDPSANDEGFGLLWPFWIMLIWAIPLVAHALYALRRPILHRGSRRRGPPP